MTPVEGRLLEIQGSPDDLETFNPPDPRNFRVNLALRIGPTGGDGGDFFYVSVCTPLFIAKRVEEEGAQWLGATLVVSAWNPGKIEQILRQWVADATGRTWADLARKLDRNARWEFS